MGTFGKGVVGIVPIVLEPIKSLSPLSQWSSSPKSHIACTSNCHCSIVSHSLLWELSLKEETTSFEMILHANYHLVFQRLKISRFYAISPIIFFYFKSNVKTGLNCFNITAIYDFLYCGGANVFSRKSSPLYMPLQRS